MDFRVLTQKNKYLRTSNAGLAHLFRIMISTSNTSEEETGNEMIIQICDKNVYPLRSNLSFMRWATNAAFCEYQSKMAEEARDQFKNV